MFDKELPFNLKPSKEPVEELTPKDIEGATSYNEAVSMALEAIRKRSYSGRNPQLGKMIKCQVCKNRHRENERKCVQKFSTGRYDLRDPKPLLIAGQTPETAPDITIEAEIPRKQIRIAVGSATFNGKRRNPHVSRRKLQFVHLVNSLLEDGWTQEELVKARKIASQILILRWGRYHFMESPIDKKIRLQKEAEEHEKADSETNS